MTRCWLNHFSIGGRNDPPAIMGVINISPESFYRPSYVPDRDLAKRCRQMVSQGASIIDIGARSTAPGSSPISIPVERDRLMRALESVQGAGITLSVDTMFPEVFASCLDFDIHALNDIRGLADPELAKIATDAGIPVIAMASRDTPGDAASLSETHQNIRLTLDRAESAGIDRVILDPGVGIWNSRRTPELDWEICRSYSEFRQYRMPLLAAVSRKTFIGAFLGRDPQDRLAGTMAVTADLIGKGASLIRAHDIAETRDLILSLGKLHPSV